MGLENVDPYMYLQEKETDFYSTLTGDKTWILTSKLIHHLVTLLMSKSKKFVQTWPPHMFSVA